LAVLAHSADHTTRAEDRTIYTQHLAAAARMYLAIHSEDTALFKEIVATEERAYGRGFLSGEEGAKCEAAFAALAKTLGPRAA